MGNLLPCPTKATGFGLALQYLPITARGRPSYLPVETDRGFVCLFHFGAQEGHKHQRSPTKFTF